MLKIYIISLLIFLFLRLFSQNSQTSQRAYSTCLFISYSQRSFDSFLAAFDRICLVSSSFLSLRLFDWRINSSMFLLISPIFSSTNPLSFFSSSAYSIILRNSPIFPAWLSCISSINPIIISFLSLCFFFSYSIKDSQCCRTLFSRSRSRGTDSRVKETLVGRIFENEVWTLLLWFRVNCGEIGCLPTLGSVRRMYGSGLLERLDIITLGLLTVCFAQG